MSTTLSKVTSKTGNVPVAGDPGETKVRPLLRQIVGIAQRKRQARSSLQVSIASDETSGVMGTVMLDECVGEARYVLLHIEEPIAPRITLSPREQEIARLVAKGYVNKTIANILEISPWTVNTHLRRIFAKLDVNSRAEMVATVLRLSLGVE